MPVRSGAAEESLREVGAPVYNFYAPDPSPKRRASAEARAALGDAAFEEAVRPGVGVDGPEEALWSSSGGSSPLKRP